MQYYLDTEFSEGFKKPISWLPTIGKFNKPYHSIQLISIGIVCEDGRTYEALSNEFNPDDANDWVKQNVLQPMFIEFCRSAQYEKRHFPESLTMKRFIKRKRKSNKQIASEIIQFVHAPIIKKYDDGMMFSDDIIDIAFKDKHEEPHKFYAYFADYDWVLFCSLFGTMMNLPAGFPMHCIDLKQSLDELAVDMHRDQTYSTAVALIKKSSFYPMQDNEHNALADAMWNMKLHKFIEKQKERSRNITDNLAKTLIENI